MSTGRTSWFARDAAYHRRELCAELGEEHGPGGLTVMDVLCGWAQEQRDPDGRVKGGFRTLRREAFLNTNEHARTIVENASEIGALDDLQIDDDGRRFTCRVSGWKADQERARAAFRKGAQRDREASASVSTDPEEPSSDGQDPGCDMSQTPSPERDMSRSGTASHAEAATRPDQVKEELRSSSSVEPDRIDAAGERRAIVARLFAYWQQQCNHPQSKLTSDRRAKIDSRLKDGYTEAQITTAIDGAARAAFVDDRGTRHDDLELICRNGSKLESFIRRASGPTSTNSSRGPASSNPDRDARRARGAAALQTMAGAAADAPAEAAA